MLAKDDILLTKANTEMNKFYSIAGERALYQAARREEHDRASIIGASRREGYAQGIDEGISQGIAQGAYQANCKTARLLALHLASCW